ncbi:cdc42 effector protein 4 [Chanos chanos]|uniref:Cdc42 effector protein 4 n=1 Tax=Chanos chanos TaxID=29144 RepID=A0A6J2VEA4_CHACN|nr:cdc42 effector protein 4 [Chanos chanos]
MPILKQLVSGSSQSKRRSRVDLTAEMISAPLGDFRHTMHVGRGGDAFGDTSFLSSHSGEPPREPEVQQNSPKQSLLSRTFRSSKRSQSVNRADKLEKPKVATSGDSRNSVKNAISLPYLNNEDVNGGGVRFPKSVSSSPLKKFPEVDVKPANGAAASAVPDLEQDERDFGEPTDLPPSVPRTGGMKHAESIMSFHVDLGPSMLGDILSVMDKEWVENDLSYEEGMGGEGHASPSLSLPNNKEENEGAPPPARPPRQTPNCNPPVPGLYTQKDSHHVDSYSGDLEQEQKAHVPNTRNGQYSLAEDRDDRDFTFMDDEDEDEIRV